MVNRSFLLNWIQYTATILYLKWSSWQIHWFFKQVLSYLYSPVYLLKLELVELENNISSRQWFDRFKREFEQDQWKYQFLESFYANLEKKVREVRDVSEQFWDFCLCWWTIWNSWLLIHGNYSNKHMHATFPLKHFQQKLNHSLKQKIVILEAEIQCLEGI